MARNKYPQTQLDNIEPTAVQGLVTSLRDLYNKGQPKNDAEVRDRINDYFLFCQNSSIRPGIESLCMALHISRTTLYHWSNGVNCTKERREIVQMAKSFIYAFVEQVVLSGKINPASGIFIMKNWMNYKDSVSIEDNTSRMPERKVLTAADLPRLDLNSEISVENMSSNMSSEG